MNKQKTQNITSEANWQTNNSVAQDELNVTADFYHPPRKEKGEIIISKTNNHLEYLTSWDIIYHFFNIN